MGTSFCLNDYEGPYVMHCKTEDEANSFLEVLHHAGRKWSSGNSYVKMNNYHAHGGKTAYYFNRGLYGNVDYVSSAGYTVLEWSDFMDDDENEISDEEFDNMLSKLLCV